MKILRPLEVALVLLYILFEELVWERFAKPIKQFIAMWLDRWLIKEIGRLHPYLILALFLLFLSVTQGFGFAAGIAFVKGMALLGAALYCAKVLMAGITFWILSANKERLFSVAWFKRAYDFVMMVREWIVTREIYLRTKSWIKKSAERLKAIATKWSTGRGQGRWRRFYTHLRRRFK
ncbi:hypothetical protein [Hydrogenimonas sp.]